MDSQKNYGLFGSSEQLGKQKVYGNSGSGGRGCFKIAAPIIILIILVLAGIFFAYPALTPNTIHGDFIDMAIVPQKDGTQRLWILTDGSFKFIQTTKSPGSYSSGVKCYACKTWTYIYDPVNEKVLKKIKTEQQDVITTMNIIYSRGKIWVITGGYHENEPKIEAYDPETNTLLMNTEQFINKYPILRSGLSDIRYDEEYNTVDFTTKDGREQITYGFDEDKLWSNRGDFYENKRNSIERGSIAVLNPEEGSGNARKRLYKISGREGKLYINKSSFESTNIESFLRASDSLGAEKMTDKIFLEGIIYYQDKDCAVVIHLDQLGKKADRILTCIDLKTGKEKWTVQQDELFKKMKIDENADPFSGLFFTKDKIKVKRSGNLVILEYKDYGFMGFDFDTGKKLWTVDI